MSASMPSRAAELIRPLLDVKGRLWLPAEAPYVLRLKCKTPTSVAIELLSSQPGNPPPYDKHRWATWHWSLTDSSLKCGHYLAEPDLSRAYRQKQLTREQMFEQTRERHIARILAAFESLSTRQNPLAGLTWCVLCGRSLTDPDSLARGIGPECLEKRAGIANTVGNTALIVSNSARGLS
ncbi:MAG: DUF6011 domain-containing protein [Gammaproteobacteria bacterium]